MAITGDVSFCDDIRHEITGKAILIGVYGTSMTIHAPPPVSIPRLCLACRLYIPVSEYPEKCEIHIYYPGSVHKPDVSSPAPLPVKLTDDQVAAATRADSMYEIRYQVGFQFELERIEVEGEGFIRVRAECNGNLVRMGDLRVTIRHADTSGKI